MKVTQSIKDIVIPLISVLTAVMVGLLNHQVSTNDQELRSRDQQLQERMGDINLLVKKSKEERDERESNQEFNLKIYEIVTESLEENSVQKQEAAKAFVVVMVDEPLRSSLLNVLKQGGDATVKQKIGQILEAEEKFKSDVAVIPEKKREETASYNWGDWNIDIFWCTGSGAKAKNQAEQIGDQLVAEGAKGRIRVRELPDSINAKAGYQLGGYAIRRGRDEKEPAAALKVLAEKIIERSGDKSKVNLSLTRQSTPNYISLFSCPSS